MVTNWKNNGKLLSEGWAVLIQECRHGLLVLFIPLCVLLTALAAAYPQVVESLYSATIYKVLSGVLGRLFGLMPFSVTEVLLMLIIPGAVIWFVTQIILLISRGGRRRRVLRLMTNICCVAGIAYLLFTLLCGFNYYRVSLADQIDLSIREASVQELADLYTELVEATNTLRGQVPEDENGVMLISPDALREFAVLAPEGMERLSERYPVLMGYTPPPKPVCFSRAMSAMNILGNYNPFTFEANINRDVQAFHIPFSMLHEPEKLSTQSFSPLCPLCAYSITINAIRRRRCGRHRLGKYQRSHCSGSDSNSGCCKATGHTGSSGGYETSGQELYQNDERRNRTSIRYRYD